MTDDPTITEQDIVELAAKLDGADLSDRDRSVLGAVFALAGHALSADNDVSGFALNAYRKAGVDPQAIGSTPLPAVQLGGAGGLVSSFSWGMGGGLWGGTQAHGSGGGGGAG